MSNARLVWADSIKGWLILLVILGHAIQSTLGKDCDSNHLWNLIYSFHMPAFVAISGWLSFKRRDKIEGVEYSFHKYILGLKRRSLQLLVPFFAWSVIVYIKRGLYTFDKLMDIIVYPDSYFWFLWVLFWICAIFNLIQLIASKFRINEMWFILTTCFALFLVMALLEFRLYGFQFLAYYFLFYTLGYCLHKYDGSKLMQCINRNACILAFSILWAFLAWGWSMHALPSWMPVIPHIPSSLLQYAYRGVTAVLAVVVIIRISPLVLRKENGVNRFVLPLGIVSLGLYVVHLAIMGDIVECIQGSMPSLDKRGCFFLSFLIALVISYLFVCLMRKNKYTAMIFLGKV